MNEQKAIWYITIEDNQPAGPYTTEQIFEFLKTRKKSETTYSWSEGMPDWQSLDSVEPFKTEIKRRRDAARKRALRIVVASIMVICVIGAAVATYFIIMGPPEVRHAKELIKAEFYKEASEVLQPYVKRNPLNNEASYLLAITKINGYAIAARNENSIFGGLFSTKASLDEAKQLLGRVFKAEPKWIEKAKADIAEAASRIPSTIPDNLNRHLEISRLRAELNLADKKQLASELLNKLPSQGGLQGNFYNRNQEAALEILNWDPSLISRIIALVFGDENVSTPQLSTGIMILQNWARERPALVNVISEELLRRASSLNAKGNREHAKLLLLKALEIDPQVVKTEDDAFLCIQLLDPNNAKLTRCQFFLRDYPDSSHRSDVIMILIQDAASIQQLPTAITILKNWIRERPALAEAISSTLLSRAETSYAKNNLEHAKLLLLAAIEIYPQIIRTEQEEFLCILLLPPDDSKLILCKHFLDKYKDSSHRFDVYMIIIRDSVTISKQYGRRNQDKAEPYIKEGTDSVKKLIEQNPRMPNLDVEVFGLAKQLVEVFGPPEEVAKDKDENEKLITAAKAAVGLSSSLLEKVPDSAIKPQIEKAIKKWWDIINPPLTIINSVDELEKMQANDFAGCKVLWVRLDRKTIGEQNIEKLRNWTQKGNALWLDTDATEAFGFGNIRPVLPQERHGRAAIANIRHAVIEGLQSRPIGYEVSSVGGYILGTVPEITNNMFPLIVAFDRQIPRPMMRVFSAIRRQGKGVVVFRPANIDITTEDGRRFEENLKSFCLKTQQQDGLNYMENLR